MVDTAAQLKLSTSHKQVNTENEQALSADTSRLCGESGGYPWYSLDKMHYCLCIFFFSTYNIITHFAELFEYEIADVIDLEAECVVDVPETKARR